MTTLFISCVSNEFASYRDAMRKNFSRPNLQAQIQEDLFANGGPALDKLDEYIRACEAVVHICGDMTGAMANAASVQYITKTYKDFARRFPVLQPVLEGLDELSYTQWEAYLAIYHDKRLFVVTPSANASRDNTEKPAAAETKKQQVHLQMLKDLGYYDEIKFENEDKLIKNLYRSKLGDIIVNGGSTIKPINLPYQSIGSTFKGREKFLKDVYNTKPVAGNCVKAIAIHGLGGIGKTRLVVEYAWQHKEDYTALLFINAGSPETFFTNIANLADPLVMNLPENTADEKIKYSAVINWLNQYKSWLLILDNVDTPEAAEKVEALFQQLQQGHVLVTTRLDSWSSQLQTMRLDVLNKEDAISFLLYSTEGKRSVLNNDTELAGTISEELGYLALALDQARAYLTAREISFAKYIEVWASNRKKIMDAFDKRITQYPVSFDITWQTSFDQLSADAKTLLNRLAWLATDPIPKNILELDVPGIAAIDMQEAWQELKKYSLTTSNEQKTAFSIHRLVQDIARNKQDENTAGLYFTEAIDWIDNAFVGDPDNVDDWPALEPLMPHAIYLFNHAEKMEAPISINRIMNDVALVFLNKAKYHLAEPLMKKALERDEQYYGVNHPEVAIRLNNLAQLLKATNRLQAAEPLMRRALEIDEKSYGPNHPTVAIRLNNLATLLYNTNRLQEAEPLMRRALEIDEKSYGSNHPDVAIDVNNLATLLKATNRLQEAEPLMRRALEIDEKNYGPDHPNVAGDVNNLAQLLQATSRLQEAEPLMRRALEIDEKSHGPNHPNVAIRLNNLARLLQDTYRLQEAEPLMRKALVIFRNRFEITHPNVQTVTKNYKALLQQMDKS